MRHLLDHSPTDESTCIAAADKDPRSTTWLNFIATGHGQLDILGKIFQVIYSLLDSVQFQALLRQIWVGIRETKETVLNDDSCTIFLLSYLAVDSRIGQESSSI